MKSKEEQDFDRIYQSNGAKVYRMCYSMTGDKDTANDLVQEIFLKVWSNLKTFKGDSSISTWIYRISINTIITFQKKSNKLNDRAKESAFMEDQNRDPEQVRLDALMKCIQQLNMVDRSIIILVLDDLSYQDIHAITGISISNIGVRISRTKVKLRKCITHEEE